ncbi:hypothetical protein [Streptomyces sp. NPDC056244]|uniref:hypothetical protein n=1 Tax=Streptomyces sp. NPDC056244 TaxID=3345762 RepID=UPI0035E21CA5
MRTPPSWSPATITTSVAQQLGNGRLHIQAPTLENGSDWYTARSGEVSSAGLPVFSVGPDGWNHLRLL